MDLTDRIRLSEGCSALKQLLKEDVCFMLKFGIIDYFRGFLEQFY